MDDYRYRMVRVVCHGKIKTCEFCKNLDYENHSYEGFCSKCGRPLDKKPGVECGHIVGYYDRGYHQQNKVHFKCKMCSTITSI
jgi:hypothetical protein